MPAPWALPDVSSRSAGDQGQTRHRPTSTAAALPGEDTAFWRVVLDNVPDSVVVLDSETGRYVYANAAVQRITAFAPEEVIGQAPNAFWAPDEMANVIAEVARLAQGRQVKSVRRVPRKGGGTVTMEVTSSPISIGRRLFYMVHGRPLHTVPRPMPAEIRKDGTSKSA